MRLLAAIAVAAIAIPTVAGTDSTSLAIAYICSAERQPEGARKPELTILKGMGTGGFAIQTANPQAQAWFDYGIKLYHGFYHDEAKLAFDKAASLDPTCAMCAWGQGLAYGSTMNYDAEEADIAKAKAATARAAGLGGALSAKDRALIAALEARYATKTGDDAAYAKAVTDLAAAHPQDNEIASLAAHALLLQARNDVKGTDEQAVTILEAALKRSPDDTAAIHYYIHATEFVGRAGLALPYAERLADLAPDASHLVHMAAHTLFRVGRYQQVALVNANAMSVDARTGGEWGYKRALGDAFYYGHNYLFGLAGAMMAGDRDLALKYADHAPRAYPEGSPVTRRHNITARGYAALGWFDPDRALALPEPPKEASLARIMRHYARGEAFAARGQAAQVLAESRAIAKIKASDKNGPPAASMGKMAAKVLEGRALMLQGKPARAAKVFEQAAKIQETTFRYAFDPPPWWYPVRRSVAAAKLQAGDHAGAVAEAKRTLEVWSGDGLAMRVLSEAERKAGDAAAADRHLAQARSLWRGDLEAVALGRI